MQWTFAALMIEVGMWTGKMGGFCRDGLGNETAHMPPSHAGVGVVMWSCHLKLPSKDCFFFHCAVQRGHVATRTGESSYEFQQPTSDARAHPF